MNACQVFTVILIRSRAGRGAPRRRRRRSTKGLTYSRQRSTRIRSMDRLVARQLHEERARTLLTQVSMRHEAARLIGVPIEGRLELILRHTLASSYCRIDSPCLSGRAD